MLQDQKRKPILVYVYNLNNQQSQLKLRVL
jgi:hypothetical protein